MKVEYIIKNSQAHIDLKSYLNTYTNLSSRQIRLLIKRKKIYINGKFGYHDTKLKENDLVCIDMSDEIKNQIVPENIEIKILYEDEYLLAVDKPAGIIMHPTTNYDRGTLANGIKYYFNSTNQEYTIRFLNRLDMNTSGVVLVPKTSYTHSKLAKMMEVNKIIKTYIGILEGVPQQKEGVIDNCIDKSEDNNVKREVLEHGKHSITIYRIIKATDNMALAEFIIKTGRTHQIRVHMSHIGCSIIGDVLYGQKSDLIDRQALHALSLEFSHPVSEENIKIISEIPNDMQKLMNLFER